MDRIRFPYDRRTGLERREGFDPSYLLKGGVERRSGRERRSKIERRKGWHRVTEWSSSWDDIGDFTEEY
jgi:hypothetical protein